MVSFVKDLWDRMFEKDTRDKIEASRRIAAGDILEDLNIMSVLPERIKEKLGYKAWTALSWALQHQWVQDYKWMLSEEVSKRDGYGHFVDIGTPMTVKYMLYAAGLTGMSDKEHDVRLSNFFRDNLYSPFIFSGGRVDKEKIPDFYQFMVEGYLTGTDFVSKLWVMKPFGTDKSRDLVQTGVVHDMNGDNQLEGELIRYWATEKTTYLRTRPLSEELLILDSYCDEYNLGRETRDNLAAKLKL